MEIFDCIVVGGGVAGLSSLVYLLMGKKNAICIEKSAPGGKLNEIAKIKNFPFESEISGPELSLKLYNHAKSLGGVIKTEEIVGLCKQNDVFMLQTSKETYYSKYVILAIGTKTGNYGFKGEDLFQSKGVSYCATCDGFFYRKKDVAVVGQSKEVIDAALYLSALCNKVYVVTPESLKENTSYDDLIAHNNIEIYDLHSLLEIKGSDKVESIETSAGNFPVSGVFLFAESKPSNAFYSSLNIESTKGYINVDSNNKTSVDGIYAAGDCISKPVRQIVNASSEGMNAALSIIKLLNQKR